MPAILWGCIKYMNFFDLTLCTFKTKILYSYPRLIGNYRWSYICVCLPIWSFDLRFLVSCHTSNYRYNNYNPNLTTLTPPYFHFHPLFHFSLLAILYFLKYIFGFTNSQTGWFLNSLSLYLQVFWIYRACVLFNLNLNLCCNCFVDFFRNKDEV